MESEVAEGRVWTFVLWGWMYKCLGKSRSATYQEMELAANPRCLLPEGLFKLPCDLIRDSETATRMLELCEDESWHEEAAKYILDDRENSAADDFWRLIIWLHRRTKNLDLDAKLKGCLEAATMSEDQALTFRIAALSVMNIIFALLDAKIETLVLAAIATFGILLPWAEAEIIISLKGCCGKSLNRLVSGLGRPDLLRLAYQRPGGARAVTFVLAEILKLWQPEMTPSLFKSNVDFKERLSGAFDASTPKQREMEWAMHKIHILRAASAQLPTMVSKFVDPNPVKDNAKTDFPVNYAQSIADICRGVAANAPLKTSSLMAVQDAVQAMLRWATAVVATQNENPALMLSTDDLCLSYHSTVLAATLEALGPLDLRRVRARKPLQKGLARRCLGALLRVLGLLIQAPELENVMDAFCQTLDALRGAGGLLSESSLTGIPKWAEMQQVVCLLETLCLSIDQGKRQGISPHSRITSADTTVSDKLMWCCAELLRCIMMGLIDWSYGMPPLDLSCEDWNGVTLLIELKHIAEAWTRTAQWMYVYDHFHNTAPPNSPIRAVVAHAMDGLSQTERKLEEALTLLIMTAHLRGIGRQDLLKAAYESGFMYQLGIRIAAPEPNYREGINKNFPAVLPISCVRQQIVETVLWLIPAAIETDQRSGSEEERTHNRAVHLTVHLLDCICVACQRLSPGPAGEYEAVRLLHRVILAVANVFSVMHPVLGTTLCQSPKFVPALLGIMKTWLPCTDPTTGLPFTKVTEDICAVLLMMIQLQPKLTLQALGRDGRMPWFGVAKEILNWPADRLKPVQGSVHRVSTAVLDAEMAQGTSARIEAGLMAKEYRDAVAQADAAMAELLAEEAASSKPKTTQSKQAAKKARRKAAAAAAAAAAPPGSATHAAASEPSDTTAASAQAEAAGTTSSRQEQKAPAGTAAQDQGGTASWHQAEGAASPAAAGSEKLAQSAAKGSGTASGGKKSSKKQAALAAARDAGGGSNGKQPVPKAAKGADARSDSKAPARTAATGTSAAAGGSQAGQQAAMPEDWMLCPITKGVMRDPVVCSDGHSYERAAVEGWLSSHTTSYVTGDPLPALDFVPNLALRNRLRSLAMY